MDIKREGVARRKRIKFSIYGVLTVAALGALGWRVSKLEPAAPTVERATVWIDSVKRGPMLREVKGLGTLVPEEIVVIPTLQDGQVIKVVAKSGEKVKPDTVLVVLTNPDLELSTNDMEWQVKQAEADLANLKVTLQSKRFDQQAAVSSAENALKQASLNKDKDEQLFKLHLQTELNVKLTQANWEQATNHFQTEKEKLDIMKDSTKAQLESQQVQIDKLTAAWQRKKQQLADLTIRAGTNGVVQELTLQVGTHVASGTVVAKVAHSTLKAALTDRRDPGQRYPAGTESLHRYTERNHPGTRSANRSERDQRNSYGGLQAGRSAAQRSRSRPQRRRDGRNRASGGCSLYRAAGVRPAQQFCKSVQSGPGWERSLARHRKVGAQLGEYHRGSARAEGGRSGDSIRHVGAGSESPNSSGLN